MAKTSMILRAAMVAFAFEASAQTLPADGLAAAPQFLTSAIERPFAVAIAYPASPRFRALVSVHPYRTPATLAVRRPPQDQTVAVLTAAHANRIDPWLLASVIDVESRWRAGAVSTKGALGLMQVMPSTARSVGVPGEMLLVPTANVEAGARQLRVLHRQFGDLRQVLAAYNAGSGAVRRYGGVPPFAETTAYVARVLARYRASGGHA